MTPDRKIYDGMVPGICRFITEVMHRIKLIEYVSFLIEILLHYIKNKNEDKG